MNDYIEFKGRNLDEAIKEACTFYGADREKLEIDIISDAKSGIFGLVGAKKATIRARRAVLPGSALESTIKEKAAPARTETGKNQSMAKVNTNMPAVAAKPAVPAIHTDPAVPAIHTDAAVPAIHTEPGVPAVKDQKAAPNNPVPLAARPRQENVQSRDRSQSRNEKNSQNRQNKNSGSRDSRDPREPKENRIAQAPRSERDEQNQERRPRATGRPQRIEQRPEQGNGQRKERTAPQTRPRHNEEGGVAADEMHNQAFAENDDLLFSGQELSAAYPRLPEIPLEELDQDKLNEIVLEAVKNLASVIVGPEASYSMDISSGRITVCIDGIENPGLLIGRDGQTLSSLQFLVGCIVSRRMQASLRVQIDAGDYRERQNEKLCSLALALAEKVKEHGKPQSTRPLSAYQRRMVHMTLQNDEEVSTHSKGEGNLKRIVIVPKRK